MGEKGPLRFCACYVFKIWAIGNSTWNRPKRWGIQNFEILYFLARRKKREIFIALIVGSF